MAENRVTSKRSKILLATFNARYAHASLGLRCLYAQLGALQEETRLCEYTLKQDVDAVAEDLLSQQPEIIGLGVYIWNVEVTTRLVRALKRRAPAVSVLVGGPEVSHELEGQDIVSLADFVLPGEADLSFRELCLLLLEGRRPEEKVFVRPAPLLEHLRMPYSLYDERDLRERVLYVEASRGCSFKCEFCLSSLDVKVRQFPLDAFLDEMQRLLDRGARQFKFIDRTFNLRLETSTAILRFFLDRMTPGLFLHFEMIPDRLPVPLRELIARFPPGTLQFEVGVQTLDESVAQRISRRQNVDRLEDNLRWLAQETGVHVHADLIVGLPGEDLETFGRGFDRLYAMGPQEIQVGMLKRLKGTPITRHDAEWGMHYADKAPFEIVQTAHLDAPTVERLRHFSKFWDRIHNSGEFKHALPLLVNPRSPFHSFLRLSDALFSRFQRTHAISLEQLLAGLLDWLASQGHSAEHTGPLLLQDYLRVPGRRTPAFLKPHATSGKPRHRSGAPSATPPSRQLKHLTS